MDRLTINIATRGRPERLLDTVTRTTAMLRRENTKLIISIDDDDEATLGIIDQLPSDARIHPHVKAREDSLGAKWNRAVEFPADVYMPTTDHVAYITEGFDEKILEAASLFPDGIGVVYPHMANFSFPAAQAITHKLVEKMGYMYPIYFPYWFVDHWVDDVAKMIDRIVFAEVNVDLGQKPPTQEMREPAFWATFFDVMRLVRRKQAADIIQSLDFIEPEWRKKMLLRNHPLHEFKSQWINDQVRGFRVNGEPPPDARYQRVKDAALKIFEAEYPALAKEIGVEPQPLGVAA
jgi:hypothetical protein